MPNAGGIVHDDVDATPGLDGRLHHFLRGRPVGDVAVEGQRLATLALMMFAVFSASPLG